MENINQQTGEAIRAIWELMRLGHIYQVSTDDNSVQLKLSDEMTGLLLATAKQEQAFRRYIGNTKY